LYQYFKPSCVGRRWLVAKKAREKGLSRKPWVKNFVCPGSQVVTQYLEKMGLQKYLDEMDLA